MKRIEHSFDFLKMTKKAKAKISLWPWLLFMIVGLMLTGCSKVIQDRGPFIDLKEGQGAKFVGYKGVLGKAVAFRRSPPDDPGDQGVILFFGDTSLANQQVVNTVQDVPDLVDQLVGTICEGIRKDPAGDFAAGNYLPGFPECKIQVGPFVFDCTFWSYLLVSEAAEETVNNVFRTLVHHLNPPTPATDADPGMMPNPATMDNLSDFTGFNDRTLSICRATPYKIEFENADFYLIEATDLVGLCPALLLRQTFPEFDDFIIPKGDLGAALDALLPLMQFIPADDPNTPANETDDFIAAKKAEIIAKIDALVPLASSFGLPHALFNPNSAWSQTEIFLDYFLERGVLFPTSAFSQADVEGSLDFKIDLFQVNLPRIKLPHPNSALFDTQNVWNENWNPLFIDPNEDIHAAEWLNNLTNEQYTICEEIFRRTEFIDLDDRSGEE